MRKDKEKAIKMRKKGKSYKQINKELGVPVSTLSDWLRSFTWSNEIKERLKQEESLSNPRKLKMMHRAQSQKWELWRQQFREEAVNEFPVLKSEPLFISGLMLYWGEGDKTMKNGRVRLVSSEPNMIKIFYSFLKRIAVPEKKIRIWLLLYPDLIESVQKNFWSKAIGISSDNFNKSIFIKGRHPTRRLSYGVCNIEIYSRGLKEKIMKWLELYQDELLRIKY